MEWRDLPETTRDKLMEELTEHLSEWKPLPLSLTKRLPRVLLNRVLELVRRMRAAGLTQSTRERRLEWLEAQLTRWIPGEATEADELESLPEPARSQAQAAERLAVKEGETIGQAAVSRRLAEARMRG